MNKVTVSGRDGLWARVRAALGRSGHAPVTENARPEQRIEEELERGWAEAAQRRVSLCVLALEMDGYAEYFAAYGQATLEQSLEALEIAITAELPRAQTQCLRSGAAGFVLVLPDMPLIMGRELAARIAAAVRRVGLPHRESHAGHVTLSMGLAVVNPAEATDLSVLEGASQAVRKAQRRGIGRLEIVDFRTGADRRRQAA